MSAARELLGLLIGIFLACVIGVVVGMSLYGCAAPVPSTRLVLAPRCPWSPDAVAAVVPDAYAALDVEVLCEDAVSVPDYWGDPAAGLTLYPGGGLIAGRILLAADLEAYPTPESSALVHELQHVALWRANGDPCSTHAASCGWVEPASAPAMLPAGGAHAEAVE